MTHPSFEHRIRHAVATLVDAPDVDRMTERIITKFENKERLIRKKVNAEILSPQGRVLIALILNPFLSVAELSVIIDRSEDKVRGVLTNLTGLSGLVRTKVGGRTRYNIDLNKLKQGTDIMRILEVLHQVYPDSNKTSDDITLEEMM